jgi:TolA-binding protein
LKKQIIKDFEEAIKFYLEKDYVKAKNVFSKLSSL